MLPPWLEARRQLSSENARGELGRFRKPGRKKQVPKTGLGASKTVACSFLGAMNFLLPEGTTLVTMQSIPISTVGCFLI